MTPTNAPDSFGWLGQVLDGRYQIEALVGRGGFGVVYRARHLTLGRTVALKFLNVGRVVDDDRRKRLIRSFVTEARILARLRSPSIVEVHDLQQATSPSGHWMPYLALEWLEGVSLDRWFADGRGRLAPDEMLRVIRPVAEALDVAHKAKIVHRDVKPANVMVLEPTAADAHIKLLDFGIAKVLQEEGITSSFDPTGQSLNAFTPAYGAPEQFDPSLGEVSARTDVHALGLIVVELLTGRPAYDARSNHDLMIAATSSERPTPRAKGAAVSAPLERVLERALALDPRNRQKSAGAFLADLESALRDEVAEVSTTVPAPTTPARAATSLAGVARSRSKRKNEASPARWFVLGMAIAAAAYGASRLIRSEASAPLEPVPPQLQETGGWTDHLMDRTCPTPCAGGVGCPGSPACPSGYTCIAGDRDARLENEHWNLHLAGVTQAPNTDACKTALRSGVVCFRPVRATVETCIAIADACDRRGWSQATLPIDSSDLVEGVDVRVVLQGNTIAERSGARYTKMVQRHAVCVGLVFNELTTHGTPSVASIGYFLSPR